MKTRNERKIYVGDKFVSIENLNATKPQMRCIEIEGGIATFEFLSDNSKFKSNEESFLKSKWVHFLNLAETNNTV